MVKPGDIGKVGDVLMTFGEGGAAEPEKEKKPSKPEPVPAEPKPAAEEKEPGTAEEEDARPLDVDDPLFEELWTDDDEEDDLEDDFDDFGMDQDDDEEDERDRSGLW